MYCHICSHFLLHILPLHINPSTDNNILAIIKQFMQLPQTVITVLEYSLILDVLLSIDLL